MSAIQQIQVTLGTYVFNLEDAIKREFPAANVIVRNDVFNEILINGDVNGFEAERANITQIMEREIAEQESRGARTPPGFVTLGDYLGKTHAKPSAFTLALKKFAMNGLDILASIMAPMITFVVGQTQGSNAARPQFVSDDHRGSYTWEEFFHEGCEKGLIGFVKVSLAMAGTDGGITCAAATSGLRSACMNGNATVATYLIRIGATIPSDIFKMPDSAYAAKLTLARAMLQVGTKDRAFITTCEGIPELAADVALCKSRVGVV